MCKNMIKISHTEVSKNSMRLCTYYIKMENEDHQIDENAQKRLTKLSNSNKIISVEKKEAH